MTGYYPPVSFSFAVWFAGAPDADAGFSEVSGLSAEWDVTEIREGGAPAPHRVPNRAKVGPITLSRGLMLAHSPLFEWCKEVMESTLNKPIEPRDLTVALLGPDGKPQITWNVVRAWPTKWEIETFKADESKVAMEKIEFACHEITREVVADSLLSRLNLNAG